MGKAKAIKEDLTGKIFANDWLVKERLNCAQYRKIYEEFTGTSTENKNIHYKCINQKCGIETYMDRTTIKRTMNNNTICMAKCQKCDGTKKSKCYYKTAVRKKNLTKIPDREQKIKANETYGNFYVERILSSGNYSDHQRRADVKCIHCGAEIKEVRSDTISEGTLTCECFRNHSSGEMAIKAALEEYNFNWKSEYTFDDLYGTGGGALRYDFAVFGDKNNLICLIEYDGEQHFKSFDDFFGGTEGYEKRQNHDKIKDDYCKEHNIPLLRIKYTDYLNIKDILAKFFTQLEKKS